jgi:hypothetical protein
MILKMPRLLRGIACLTTQTTAYQKLVLVSIEEYHFIS